MGIIIVIFLLVVIVFSLWSLSDKIGESIIAICKVFEENKTEPVKIILPNPPYPNCAKCDGILMPKYGSHGNRADVYWVCSSCREGV
jgi:hypothetical protein